MATRDSFSILDILNVELLALVEYAKSNPGSVNLDPTSDLNLKNALHNIANYEISASMGNYEVKVKSKDPKTGQKSETISVDENKKAKYERAIDRLDNTERMADVARLVYGALHHQANLDTLYKQAGSLLSLVAKDKSYDKEAYHNYGITNEITDSGTNYFVPKVVFERARDATKTDSDALNKAHAYQCSYKMKQGDTEGNTYIEGAIKGLERLLGTEKIKGILPACGISGTLVKKPSRVNGLSYRILLDKTNTEKFISQLLAPSSAVDDNNVQAHLTFTSLILNKETTTSEMAPPEAEDTDDQAASENSAEGQLTELHERMKENVIDDHSNEDTIDNSIKIAYDKIKRIIDLVRKGNQKLLRFETPDVACPTDGMSPLERDPARLKWVDAINKFYKSVAKLTKVDIPEDEYKISGNTYRFVEPDPYGKQLWAMVSKLKVLFEGLPDTYERLVTDLAGLNKFLNGVVGKLQSIFVDMKKVGDMSVDNTSEVTNVTKEIAKARASWDAYMNEPVITAYAYSITRDRLRETAQSDMDDYKVDQTIRRAVEAIDSFGHKVMSAKTADALPSAEDQKKLNDAFAVLIDFYSDKLVAQLWFNKLVKQTVYVDGKFISIEGMLELPEDLLPDELNDLGFLVEKTKSALQSYKTYPNEAVRADIQNQVTALAWWSNLLNKPFSINGQMMSINDLYDLPNSKATAEMKEILAVIAPIQERFASPDTYPNAEERAQITAIVNGIINPHKEEEESAPVAQPEPKVAEPVTHEVKNSPSSKLADISLGDFTPVTDADGKSSDDVFDDVDFGEVDY